MSLSLCPSPLLPTPKPIFAVTPHLTSVSLLSFADEQIADSVRIHEAVAKLAPVLADLAEQMAERFRSGGRVYFFGNGGSAADAQHWAAELSGRFYLDRPSLPAFALTGNSSQVTAIGNDYGFEEVFARPLSGMIQPGDVAIGISTSGNSVNVVRGLETAREKSALAVGFTGKGEGRMAGVCDVVISIPSEDTPRIQEGHELCGHVLCALVERIMFGKDDG